MFPASRFLLRVCGGALMLWALAALPTAHAQKQEEGILVKVKRGGSANDESFAFNDANKAFNSHAAVGDKQARTKPYAFTGSSSFGGSDGTFRTKSFADKGKFGTDTFATKADRASSGHAFTEGDRGFATKALPVADASESNKSAPVRKYAPADKSIVIVGKRQDDLDDLYHQKNLSIDEVREILNKPGHGTDAPVQKVGPVPVLRALPVTAPAAQ